MGYKLIGDGDPKYEANGAG